MAKVTRIEKSRKEVTCSKCGKVLQVGSAYLKATPFHRAPILRCTNCGLKSWETSGSDYVLTVAPIVEEWASTYGTDDGAASSIADDLTNLRDDLQDRFDNIPEQLQDGDAGSTLQERIDTLDDVITELEDLDYDQIHDDADDEVDKEDEPEIGDFDSEEEFRDRMLSYQEYLKDREDEVNQVAEENYSSAIDEALSAIEY